MLVVRELAFAWFASMSRRSRVRRMENCVRLLGIGGSTRVLDVGGTLDIWRLAPVLPRLTVLNQPRADQEICREFPVVFGDGTALPFANRSFDVVFSNSVIEHVGDAARQGRFAAEIARVGRKYWVETPNRYFFVEQHLWTPFLHWLPKRWQARVLRSGTVWERVTRPTPDRRKFYLEHYLMGIGLLSGGKLQRLFPDAQIRRERFLGWTKSLIAVSAGGYSAFQAPSRRRSSTSSPR
jgi:SAM-dependent methyltransferase